MSNKQLTIPLLKDIVSTYVAQNKISNPSSFVATTDNVAGLLDKIAKTYTIDGSFVDKLAIFDGDELPYGKTLEEYYQNLIAPSVFDSTGASTLAPAYPTYMKPCYSYTLGRKMIKTTEPFDNLNRAFHTAEEYASAFSQIAKRVEDSQALYKYNIKKELLCKTADLCIEAMDTSNASLWASGTSRAIGDAVYNSTEVGIVVKAYDSSDNLTWAQAKAGGFVVLLDLVTELAQPSDESSGIAFVKAVKKLAKKSKYITEGNSLNGNTVGATEGLVLVVLSDVVADVEVETLAGAFHNELLEYGVEQIEVDDFGSDTNGVYAMLVDRRGVKVHPTYNAVRTQENADGDFINIVRHSEFTCASSRNTFIHVFKKP